MAKLLTCLKCFKRSDVLQGTYLMFQQTDSLLVAYTWTPASAAPSAAARNCWLPLDCCSTANFAAVKITVIYKSQNNLSLNLYNLLILNNYCSSNLTKNFCKFKWSRVISILRINIMHFYPVFHLILFHQ